MNVLQDFRRACVLAMAMLLALTPADAGMPFKKGKFKFDPAKGYLLVRVGPNKSAKGNPPLVGFMRLDVKLTRADSVPNSEELKEILANIVVAGGKNALDVSGDASIYLAEANPGYWVISHAHGGVPTIMSLGTYGFKIRPGEITYVGTIYSGPEDGTSPVSEIARSKISDDLISYGTVSSMLKSSAIYIIPPNAADEMPSEVSTLTVRPAELEPDIRFENFGRGLVNRVLNLPAMGHEKIPDHK